VCQYAGACCKVKAQNLPLARFARARRARGGGFGCWPDLLRGEDQTKAQSANADGANVDKALPNPARRAEVFCFAASLPCGMRSLFLWGQRKTKTQSPSAFSERSSDQRERARGHILSAMPARHLVSENSQRLQLGLSPSVIREVFQHSTTPSLLEPFKLQQTKSPPGITKAWPAGLESLQRATKEKDP